MASTSKRQKSQPPAKRPSKSVASGASPRKGKSLTDFRSLHDKNYLIPKAIEAGLAKLGKDGWEYELEFMKLCGVCSSDFARYRDKFEDFYLTVGGRGSQGKRVWAGSKALATRMRSML